ncbi:ATP-binding protein [Lutibacter sp. A64]|uniref:AAA family ATPase n=1 Tax=Lutibacter sp. A64 TaxID=2918526 RepID=UPI001F06A0FE|nr:ATP-binding protein [Lutibacter sp. A64]UMB53458.1 ATP-binding protein [Lutibacter sp. A64]
MEKTLKQTNRNIVKIVLFGPESTGKTTLSKQLARHYNTVWVPEYARTYLQNKWNNKREYCDSDDQLPIAYEQIKLENKLAKKADRLQICDTDLLETVVYFENYYDKNIDANLKKAALENTYDLYLLTYIDTPWEADDIRENPEKRQEMFEVFENALIKYNRPYILLTGSKKNRLNLAVTAIDKILASKPNLQRYSVT